LTVGEGLASQLNVAVAGIVATAVLLELRFTVSPATGAIAERRRTRVAWFPVPTMLAF
jgi:hypothetical protein